MPYKNKELQAKSAKKHYKKNKSKFIKRSRLHKRKSRAIAREFIQSYLINHPCVDCGENDPIVLEFDHIKGNKLFNLGAVSSGGYGIIKIKEEIDKCEIRCANCHRRKTYRERIGE